MKVKGKNYSMCNKGQRKKSDFYETPYSMSQQLLDAEQLTGTILEPACGNGAIVKVLNKNGYACDFYDIEKDFLTEIKNYNTIITNPPFSLSMQFIKKAKEICDRFWFLLPLNYLHGKKRYDEVWMDYSYHLKKIYVFVQYPMLGESLQDDGKYKSGMMVYAWYGWEKGYDGPPSIHWIDNHKYIRRNKK